MSTFTNHLISKTTERIVRVAVTIGLIMSAVLVPWYIAVGFVLIGFVLFPVFYGGIIAGVMFDWIYGSHLAGWWFGAPFLLGALLVFILSGFLRDRVR